MNHKYSTYTIIGIIAVIIIIATAEAIDGYGTTGFLAKFSNGGIITNSTIYDDGTTIINVSRICSVDNGLCSGSPSGSGVNFFDLIDRDYYYRNTGFESVTAGYLDPWVPTAIAGGTSNLMAGLINHPGMADLRSGTASNSGYAFQISGASTYLLGANYMTIGSFKVGRTGIFFNSSNLTANDTYIRFGFMDVFTVGAVTDGVFFNISHNETNLTTIYARGVARNNSCLL